MSEHGGRRRPDLDLYPGARALLVVEVDVLRRRETGRGVEIGVLLPRVLTADDFASPEAAQRLLAARRRADCGRAAA